MMDTELIKVAAQVAGIGGVAVAGSVLVFRDVVRRNIFPRVSQEHAYQLIKLIVIFSGAIAIAGILAWTIVQISMPTRINGSPKPLDLSIARTCIRPSGSLPMVNTCSFPIGIKYCYMITGNKQAEWEKWMNWKDSCVVDTSHLSPVIKPGEAWPFPMNNIPQLMDGHAAALNWLDASEY